MLSLGWRCKKIELSIFLVKKKYINTSNHSPRTQLLAIQCISTVGHWILNPTGLPRWVWSRWWQEEGDFWDDGDETAWIWFFQNKALISTKWTLFETMQMYGFWYIRVLGFGSCAHGTLWTNEGMMDEWMNAWMKEDIYREDGIERKRQAVSHVLKKISDDYQSWIWKNPSVNSG